MSWTDAEAADALARRWTPPRSTPPAPAWRCHCGRRLHSPSAVDAHQIDHELGGRVRS